MGNFEENGFLIKKSLFKPEEIKLILNDIKHIFSIQLEKNNYSYSTELEFNNSLFDFFKKHREVFINCGKHMQHLISVHKLSLDDRIINTLLDLGLSFPTICTRPVVYANSKNLATEEIYYKMPAHKDWYSMQGSLDSMVVWIPLVDVNKDLGALEIVSGSHKDSSEISDVKNGFGLVNKYTDKDFTSVELNAGDALFFSSMLVHRSGNNITDLIRYSTHYRFNNMNDPDFINRNFPHPYIYEPLSKNPEWNKKNLKIS